MNIAEQIAKIKATLESKRKTMEAVAAKAAGEERSMNTAESEEFDTLLGETKTLESDLARYETLQRLDAVKAVPAAAGGAAVAVGAAAVPVQVKNTEKLEPGIGFARAVRVKALAYTGQVNGLRDPLQIAKQVYPQDERLVASLQQKAAVDAANTLNAGWAGNLIIEGGGPFADFVEYLRPRTLLGQISGRLRTLPFDTPVLIQSTGGSASWVKEGSAKPLTEWTYSRANLKPLKVASIAAATKETLMRSSLAVDTLIRDELARAVGAAIDTTFLSTAAAVTDTSPAGILNGVAPITLTGGSDYQGFLCDAATLKAAFIAANQTLRGAFWVMSEVMASNLADMRNELGQTAFPNLTYEGGSIGGIPVVTTQYVGGTSAGSILALIKGDDIFLGDEGGVQVATSDQASLVMDTAPTMNSLTPTAAQMVSMWQTNSVAFLVERFINWQRRRDVAVAWGYADYDACVAP